MARIRIEVSEDRMLAHVHVEVGEPPLAGALRTALREAGVVSGILDDTVAALDESLQDALFVTDRDLLIAAARPAQRGFDGFFTPEFAPGIRPGHVREDGTMDFFDRELIKSVLPGGRIGTWTQPSPGVAGQRVDGAEIPAVPGAPCKLVLGAGLVVRDDGAVIAEAGGAIVYVPDRTLEITQRMLHGGSVDLRSGHLDMRGSVVVSGDVTRGFHVVASGDLEVRGQCDGGELRAGGHVRVLGTLRGGADGRIEADGDVQARNAEAVEVVAGGTITLQQAVNARLRAREIVVTQQIRGGTARAELSITAKDTGTPQGSVTELEVAVPRQTADDVRRVVALAKSARFADRRAGSDDRAKGGKAGREKQGIARDELSQKITQARLRDELLRDAFIALSGTVQPGTVCILGGFRHEVRDVESAQRVSFDGATRQLRIERTGR